MGLSNNKKEKSINKEGYIPGHSKDLSLSQMNKFMKQMNKSIYKIESNFIIGTGFLCLITYPNIEHLLKTFITCNLVLKDLNIGNEIKLIYENNERIIKLDESRIIYTDIKYDITIIELKDNEFELNNYLKIDIDIEEEIDRYYGKKSIYIIHYPKGKEVKYSIDSIMNIEDEYVIKHGCTTDQGSSGSPILNLDTYNVIGIHIGKSKDNTFNMGHLIKLPIDDLNKNNKKNENKKRKKNNYIFAEIEIKENDLIKDIRIINSFEEYKREIEQKDKEDDYKNENEKEIKENYEIKINGKIIKFSYFYKFNKIGKYQIKYSFKNNSTKINHLFCGCSSLKEINFSNFNTKNVINVSFIFSDYLLYKL